jgi:hypothetical protein
VSESNVQQKNVDCQCMLGWKFLSTLGLNSFGIEIHRVG